MPLFYVYHVLVSLDILPFIISFFMTFANRMMMHYYAYSVIL